RGLQTTRLDDVFRHQVQEEHQRHHDHCQADGGIAAGEPAHLLVENKVVHNLSGMTVDAAREGAASHGAARAYSPSPAASTRAAHCWMSRSTMALKSSPDSLPATAPSCGRNSLNSWLCMTLVTAACSLLWASSDMVWLAIRPNQAEVAKSPRPSS